ncbi:MAG: hypothetical protein KKB59_05680 [Spirochaetes bacterium]|nr:hypothetical protein [Spirochaetota bacterium]
MRKTIILFIAAACASALAAQEMTWIAGGSPAPLEGWMVRRSAAGAAPSALGESEGFSPYSGAAIDAPGAERRRVFEFRASFALDGASAATPLALYMGPGDYPRDVYLNGHRLLRTGDHGERYASTVFYSSRIPLPPDLLEYDGAANVVSVMAYPDYEIGPLGDVFLGDYYDISGLVFLRDLFNVRFIQAAFVVACFIGLFFFLLFVRSPDKDVRYLLFSLTCAAFALGHVNLSFYHDALNEVALLKASRTGLALTSLFFALFAMRFTGFLASKRWIPPLLSLPVAASIVGNLIQPDKRGASLFFASVTTNFVLTPLLVLTLVVLVVGFARKRDPARAALLAGFIVSIASSLVDMSRVAANTIPFCYLTAYGYMVLLVAIFFVLALEQSEVSRQLAAQSGKLNERNGILVDMVRELKDVAAGLVASSSSLDAAIDSTLRSVEEFGGETHTASEAFRSQSRAVEGEIDGIAERLSASAYRVPKALESQTAAVEKMNATLSDMGQRIEENLGSAGESSRIAERLAADAEDGSRVIARSRDAMNHVAELSGALQGVLSSIEDIAERTHILSINAAIESARLGAQGKGFAVVAQEIRTLSEQSRTSLASSFAKIGEIAGSVSESTSLSETAAATLLAIAEQARTSAQRTEDIRRLIELQRGQGEDMVKDADALLSEARLLKELSVEEKRSNEERSTKFAFMKESLASVSGALDRQEGRKGELSSSLDTMRAVMAENARHIDRLKGAISRIGDV